MKKWWPGDNKKGRNWNFTSRSGNCTDFSFIYSGFDMAASNAADEGKCPTDKCSPGASDCPKKRKSDILNLTLSELNYSNGPWAKAKRMTYKADSLNSVTMTHVTDQGTVCRSQV